MGCEGVTCHPILGLGKEQAIHRISEKSRFDTEWSPPLSVGKAWHSKGAEVSYNHLILIVILVYLTPMSI